VDSFDGLTAETLPAARASVRSRLRLWHLCAAVTISAPIFAAVRALIASPAVRAAVIVLPILVILAGIIGIAHFLTHWYQYRALPWVVLRLRRLERRSAAWCVLTGPLYLVLFVLVPLSIGVFATLAPVGLAAGVLWTVRR
jgi:hypothetical protein